MKRKRIIIVIISIILFYTICISGYIYMSKRMDNVERRGFILDAQEYLTTNEEFTQKYGKIVSFEAIDDEGPTPSEKQDETEYYMDFRCVTEKEELLIRIYHVWNDGWSFYYVIL